MCLELYIIPMPIDSNDSNVSRRTQLRYISFIEYILYLRFETSQSWRPLLKAIGALKYFSLCSKFGEAMIRSLKELNFNVKKEYVFNKKQTTLISDIF